MASRRHLTAFNRTVKALGVADDNVCAMIVALGRDLARKLDSSEEPAVWAKVAPLYMRAGRELKLMADRELVLRKPEAAPVTENVRKSDREPTQNVNSLSAFRDRHGIEAN